MMLRLPSLPLSVTAALTIYLLGCQTLNGQQMVFPGETWDSAPLETVLVDPAKLVTAIDSIAMTSELGGLMILRNGRAIWQGEHAQQVYLSPALAKEFVSTGLGLLVDDGAVTLDALASSYVPSLAEDYPQATLGHFVKQTSGYTSAGLLVPGEPEFAPPGSEFYDREYENMLANIVTRAAEEPLAELFGRRIADKVGMDREALIWGSITADDGVLVNFGNSNLSTTPSNAARFGHLFLNRGMWEEQRLISSDWVDTATQPQLPPTFPRNPAAHVGPGLFGISWWLTTPGWYQAMGGGNQGTHFLSINPSMGMVVVNLGGGIPPSSYQTLLSRLEDVSLPAIWDGHGNGYWDDLNGTGKPRWITDSGLVPDIYPTTSAIIRSNTVSVRDRLRVGDVDVESGQLQVELSADFGSSGQIRVHPGAAFTSDGSVQANEVLLNGNGAFIIDGKFAANELEITDGSLTIHDMSSPFVISNGFQVEGNSELRLIMKDESWDSTITIKEFNRRTTLTFAGQLVLEFAPELNPKVLEGTTLNLLDWNDRYRISTRFDAITTPSRVTLDVSDLYTTGDVLVESVLSEPLIPGDFNGDLQLDAVDVDALAARIRVSSTDAYYDVNGDGKVSRQDQQVWVADLKGTSLGDADMSGQVELADFLSVSENFGREGGWKEGDFDGDGKVLFSDFLILSDNFGKTQRNVAAVPEPNPCLLVLFGLLGIVSLRHRRTNRANNAWGGYARSVLQRRQQMDKLSSVHNFG